MFLPYTHESIRLTGRWDTSNPACATATATGSYLEFCFDGDMAVARFDIDANMSPLLHLWVQLDGGDMVEASVDRYIRVRASRAGRHICRIIYKGGTEVSGRWYQPLRGKVTFLGVQTDRPAAIPADTRPVIEFIGDSITEGVLIDTDYREGTTHAFELDQLNRCYQDDVCATYAWLTAEALNLRPVFMGYGAVGVTRVGCSRVPAAPAAFPYNFDGSPITYAPGDFVVINHGANDRGAPPERYQQAYAELLDLVRERNPKAVVVALSAFCGGQRQALEELVERYNRERGANVHFINGSEWIPPEPLHPMRDGHRKVAKQLAPILREIFGLPAVSADK